MIKALGVLMVAAFITASLAGTVTSGWFLGEALSPLRGGPIAGPLSLGMVLVLLACAAEGLRLGLALTIERIWRRSPFQAFAVAWPMWLACTGYCTLMPLLALALLPLFPVNAEVLTVLGPAWVLVQAAAGLLPAIAWAPRASSAAPLADGRDDHAQAANAAGRRLLPASSSLAPTSADELFQLLDGLSGLPPGSAISQRGRVGRNREIVISQAGLAEFIGQPRPTVRRWLQELERHDRIARRGSGKAARIVLQPAAENGLNGGGTHSQVERLQPQSRAA